MMAATFNYPLPTVHKGPHFTLADLMIVVLVATRVMLCNFGVEFLLLFWTEQSAYLCSGLLPERIVTRAHLVAQRSILAARLIQDGAYLLRLLVGQAEVALHL